MTRFLAIFILFIASTTSFSQAHARQVKLFNINRPNYVGKNSSGVKYTELSLQFSIEFDNSTCMISSNNPISTYMVLKSSGKYYDSLSSNNRKAFAVKNGDFSIQQNQIEFTTLAFEKLGISFLTVLEKRGSSCSPSTKVISNKITSTLIEMDMYFNLKEYPLFGLHPDKNDPIQSLLFIGKSNTYCYYGKCP